MVRWSLKISAMIAVFWGSFMIIHGYVPIATGLQVTPKYWFDPDVSRLWDIAIGPIWGCIAIWALTRKWFHNESVGWPIIVGVLGGLYAEITAGLHYGWSIQALSTVKLDSAVYVSIIIGLPLGLYCQVYRPLAWDSRNKLAYAVMGGLAEGLVVGIFAGIVAGAVFAVTTGIVTGAIFEIIASLAAATRLLTQPTPAHG